jgi:hypothetical protein
LRVVACHRSDPKKQAAERILSPDSFARVGPAGWGIVRRSECTWALRVNNEKPLLSFISSHGIKSGTVSLPVSDMIEAAKQGMR